MKKNVLILYFFCIICCLTSKYAFGQISERGTPISFSLDILEQEIPVLIMPSVDVKALLEEDEKLRTEDVQRPFRFGYAIDVNIDVKKDGMKKELQNGDNLWLLKIYSFNAYSINLIYNRFILSEGAKFFIYNEDRTMILGAFTPEVSYNPYNEFATDLIQGNIITLEYYEPKLHNDGVTGLQTLCNTFEYNRYSDILVGRLPMEIGPPQLHSIRPTQGSTQESAGNLFNGKPTINIDNQQSQWHINYYRNPFLSNETPNYISNVTLYPASSNSCPSKIGNIQVKGREGITNLLAQYDEWNAEYESWLAQLLAFEGEEGEEYDMLLNNVSYYSALKDNYFNWVVVSAFKGEEEKGEEEKGKGAKARRHEGNGRISPSNFEGVPEGRGSLYEKITIYPNPTTGELEIRNYELGTAAPLGASSAKLINSIEVFDVYGRKVSSHHLITSSSNHLINLSHLNSGIYFVKITTDAGEVVKKIIKQ